MRLSSALLALCLLAACEDENPGLLLHVVLPSGSAPRVSRVVVTLESLSGPLGMQSPTPDHGVVVSTQGGKVQLEFVSGRFPIGPSFDILLVPRPARNLSVHLYGQAFLAGGALMASAGPTADVILAADRRTSVTLDFACIAACNGVPVGTIDLAMPPQSPKTAALSGASDGDRLIPLAIGHFDDANRTRGDLVAAAPARGLVYVLFGRDWNDPGFPILPDRMLSPADAQLAITLKSGQIVGAAAAGDIDGDGLDDLIVSAFNADAPTLPTSSAGAGAAYVFPGTRIKQGGSIDLGQPADDALVPRIYGGSPQQQLGRALALASISTPGRVDLILGAPGAAGSAAGGGRVYVFFGRSLPHQIFTVDPGQNGGQDATILGARAGLPIGRVLAAADLADGDGKAEIVMGNPLDAGQRGTVTVLRGASITAGAVIDLSTTWDLVVTGPSAGQLGSALALGDLDGSGRVDLAIGAPGADTVYVLAPALAPGMTQDVGAGRFEYALKGPTAGAGFGSALAIGHLDADAAADLLVGAPSSAGPDGTRAGAGSCLVVLGSQLGTIVPGMGHTRLLMNEPAALTVHGAKPDGGLGGHVVAGNWDVLAASDKVIGGAEAAMNARGMVYAIHDLP
ncbi:MAG TPA: FG-GAP repeat protein [Polyangia bacterium]|nr:FG-GAP repeat protein [Polyangia bacterium]